jgi:divinyl chlorophyllide a 8-vinyl-reductase
MSDAPTRVFLLGATGTIGRATAAALLARGYQVTALVRRGDGLPPGIRVVQGSATDPGTLRAALMPGFDAVVSCLASRTGAPKDAWAVDYRAHSDALQIAVQAGVRQFVLLSAICVQRPKLAFQQAKLAFEAELTASGMEYSIVRPTAYFKSLSGQVDRVRRGKPFLLFGDGGLTACKPISDADLGEYLVGCLTDPSRRNRILPIGGPGPAMTPRQQGEELFRLLGVEPRFSQVPVRMMDVIIGVLSVLGRVAPGLRDKAELARIGRYYATESMLVLDPETGLYDADATPETGRDRLIDHQAKLLRGEASVGLGEHAVFQTL